MFCFFGILFRLFLNIVVVESSSLAKAGDAEGGIVLCVLLW